MDSALAWIGHFSESLGGLIPRLKIEPAIKPGLCVFWPIVTEIEIMPVARQTHNLASQSLTTRDGRRVVLGAVDVYAITDVVAALSKNWNVADTINDVTMCAITQVITSHDYQYLLENLTGAVQDELTRATRLKLKAYGVRVYRTALTAFFSTALVVKNIGGSTILAAHNLE